MGMPIIPIIESEMLTETKVHHFATEASDIRIPAGYNPRALSTNMGNKQPFILVACDEMGTLKYKQQFGCISLLVFND